MFEPKALKKLSYDLSKLPGVGPKTARRLALFILNQPRDFARELADTLDSLHANVKVCSFCRVYSDTDPCNVCGDAARRLDMLTVVKNSVDVYTLENLGVYAGQYLVLDVGTSSYNIEVLDTYGKLLLKRVRQLLDLIKQRQRGFKGTFEVIFALGAGIEEQTLMLFLRDYLTRKAADLGQIDFRFSRLAIGLSGGSSIDFVDSYTLREAFNGRRELD